MAHAKTWAEKFFVLAVIVLLCGMIFDGEFQGRTRKGTVVNIVLPAIFQFPAATLHQFATGGTTAIPEGATVMAGTVVLGVSFASDVIVPLRLQVEVRPTSVAFTGTPTASGSVIILTKQSAVTVSGLADGSYHWRARLANAVTGAASNWQEFGSMSAAGLTPLTAGGNADFTVALREPVVIIPGISGTALDKASDGSEVWPDVDKMLLSPSDGYLDALALDANGNDAGSSIRTGAILSSAKLTLGSATLFDDDFYGNLIAAFVGEGYVSNQNLFTAPYDWRLDISESAQAVSLKIAQAVAVSPTGKINIIAHSMGGLVLKKYLAGLSPSSAAFLDNVILVGVPELGAPYAFKILNYGDDLGIPIVNQNEVKKITQNMPAIYELLPSRDYVAAVGGYVQDFREGANDTVLDYAATANFATGNAGDARNASLAGLADDFHQSIDGAPVVAPHLYDVAGCGKPTITGFDIYDDGAVDLERGSGDGTVPEVSAMDMAGAGHDYFVLSGETGIDHTGLVSDARPIALIKNIVDGTVSTAALPQGISTRESDCSASSPPASSSSGLDSTVEFSASGGVSLGVYDAAGDFTGMTAAGALSLGVPGSEYDQLASSTFVLVPAGNSYKAVSDAMATGTFAMKVRSYHDGAVDREANYLSVPAPDTSTVAELDFAGFDANMDLHLGNKGRANFESVRHPDSTTSASGTLKDHIPPTITISPLPREISQNATATISWTVTDFGSGVATTSATLNGIPVTNSSVVSFATPGANLLKIQAIDNAGNPRVKEVEVDVQLAAAPSK